MKDWMLTNKEIHKALGWTNNFESLCKAQARKTIVWVNADCDNPKHGSTVRCYPTGHIQLLRAECPKCMEWFVKEVGL